MAVNMEERETCVQGCVIMDLKINVNFQTGERTINSDQSPEDEHITSPNTDSSPTVLNRHSRTDTPGRQIIVRPNPELLPQITTPSPYRTDDLRSELQRKRIDSADRNFVTISEISGGNSAENDYSKNGSSEHAGPEDCDLRNQLKSRTTGHQYYANNSTTCKNVRNDTELEEDRLSLTADDDLGINDVSGVLQKVDKSFQPVKQKGEHSKEREMKNSSQQSQSKAMKMPPVKPNSTNTVLLSKRTEKSSLKQPPAKPDSRSVDTKTPTMKSSLPDVMKPGRNEFGQSAKFPTVDTNCKGNLLSKVGEGNRASQKPVFFVKDSIETKKPCQNCKNVEEIDGYLEKLLQHINCRPSKIDNFDVISNVLDICFLSKECKIPNIAPIVMRSLVTRGTLDEKSLADLFTKIINEGYLSPKDFKAYLRPLLEHICLSNTDCSNLQNILGFYWYFADWSGLWEVVVKLVVDKYSKLTVKRKLPLASLKSLLRLVLLRSCNRAGLIAWLIVNLPKRDITSNFSMSILLKLLPLLESRNLYRLRIKLEELIGYQPTEELKSKNVLDKLSGLGKKLSNHVSRKQLLGVEDELPNIAPGTEDIVAEVNYILTRTNDDDLVMEALSLFFSYFNSRVISDHPDLKKIFSCVVFSLTRHVKSRSNIPRLIFKLDKLGVDFSSYLSADPISVIPGNGKPSDVSVTIAESFMEQWKETPDLKSKAFSWITGPTFIPLSQITNREEFYALVTQKASFFNRLLEHIPETSVSAQHCDFFAQILKACMQDMSNSNFKEEYKSLYHFEKVYNRLCVNCVKSQRTALLNDLFEHMNTAALFPKTKGSPSELIFRLFIASFALRDDKSKSVAAYRQACYNGIFKVQPESTSEGFVVINIPAYLSEPEILTILNSTLDCMWKLDQDGSFPSTSFPQLAMKIDSVSKESNMEGISIFNCSNSEDQVYSRIRAAATTLGISLTKTYPSVLIKMEVKDVVSLFGRWKNSTRKQNLPKFELTMNKFLILAKESSTFKSPVPASPIVDSRSTSFNGGQKRYDKTEKGRRGLASGHSKPPTNDEQFKIPKRSRYEELEEKLSSPPKMPKQHGVSPLDRSAESKDPQPHLFHRQQAPGSGGYVGYEHHDRQPHSTRQGIQGVLSYHESETSRHQMDRDSSEDPLRTTEKLLRRVGQYLQDKDGVEHENLPSNEPVRQPTQHAHTKLVEVATSAVFQAVRDAANVVPEVKSEAGITRAWQEFQERRSGGGQINVPSGAHSVNPYAAPRPMKSNAQFGHQSSSSLHSEQSYKTSSNDERFPPVNYPAGPPYSQFPAALHNDPTSTSLEKQQPESADQQHTKHLHSGVPKGYSGLSQQQQLQIGSFPNQPLQPNPYAPPPRNPYESTGRLNMMGSHQHQSRQQNNQILPTPPQQTPQQQQHQQQQPLMQAQGMAKSQYPPDTTSNYGNFSARPYYQGHVHSYPGYPPMASQGGNMAWGSRLPSQHPHGQRPPNPWR